MPISRTCYFCELFYDCDNIEAWTSPCENFTPNADWLYIEQLQKENEELKRKIESYKYEREKLHGYLAKSEAKE